MGKRHTIASLAAVLCSLHAATAAPTSQPVTDSLPGETLTAQSRILGLVEIWATAKQHFAYFDRVPDLDWDHALVEYLPKVEASTTIGEYYDCLQAFAAKLNDGHTRVNLPQTLQDQRDNLPIRIEEVEGQWVVTGRFPTKEILDEDIPVGSVILNIEGKSVSAFLRENLRVDTSTMSIQAVHGKLNGWCPYPRDKNLRLTFRYPDDSIHQRSLRANRREASWTSEHRKQYLPAWRQHEFFSETIKDNILYVRYPECDGTNTDRFLQLLSTITDKPPQALIVDLRGNSGGTTPTEVVRHLIPTTVPSIGMRTRCSISYLEAYLQAVNLCVKSPEERHRMTNEIVEKFMSYGLVPSSGYTPGWVSLPNKEGLTPTADSYRGLLIVLTNWETGSAAEDMVLLLRQSANATIIGTPTFGSSGQPYVVPLPGGGMFQVCSSRSISAGGVDLLPFRGIQPDVTVEPTIASLVAQQDIWVKAAIEYIATWKGKNGSSTSPSPRE